MLLFNGNKTEKRGFASNPWCLPAVQRYRSLHGVHRHREKSIHKKALNSCSVPFFTAGIIKGGFYRLSNPNFPISRWRPVQSHLCSIQGKGSTWEYYGVAYAEIVLIALKVGLLTCIVWHLICSVQKKRESTKDRSPIPGLSPWSFFISTTAQN